MNCANHPERERIAFCQNCGKPLCQECARVIGTAVFCEPCLEARLSGSQGTPYTTTVPPGAQAPPIPPVPGSGVPNPGLAALLGFIPGVGAMYNGQYTKGIVHLIVFAVLVSLADEHGIFGLFVTGWIFYQVIEAYQTAKARRDETPLPNPFGLNDLGERFGFGKAWTAGPPTTGTAASTSVPYTAAASEASVPPSAGPYQAPGSYPPTSSSYPPASSSYPPASSNYPPPGSSWGAPAENFTGSPYNNPYTGSPYNATYTGSPYVSPSSPAFDPNGSYSRNRFPTGALWLIGLGAIFLIGNTGLFHGFPVHRLFPFFLIGLGVWLFVHKMTASGATLADDGTAIYRLRLFSALRGSVWVVLVGVMFLLSSFDILSWGSSWPLFIIVAGVMILAEKTFYNPAAAAPAYPMPPVPPVTTATAPPAPGPIVPPPPPGTPSQSPDQEGR